MSGSSLLHGATFALLLGAVLGTPCSPQNRTNLADCLQRIKEIMYDPSLFWFGNSYATRCPNASFTDVKCSNPSPGQGLSVATRAFPNGLNDSLLTEFLTVKFTSDPGEYTGCGNTFRSDQTIMYDIDPSSSQILQPWYVRHTPEMTWNSEPGEYYSVYIYDVGTYITHAVYINIQGNAIPTTGDNVIDAYHGPLTTRNEANVYIFLLFKQNGYLDPATAQEWYNVTHSLGTMASSSHIPDFMTLLNMTGPIAINWIAVTGDEYAAETMYTRRILVMCPIYIGLALDMKPRPFLPSPSSLTVKMDISLNVEALTYSACCRIFTETARTMMLNPIGNELLQTSATRSGLVQTVTFEKLGFYNMARNFSGEMYTMIAFDPDVPSPTVGNGSHPLLHQMQINIMDGNFTSGEEVIPWNGPYPPNDEPHYYYFLLYQHTDPVNATEMMSYAADCGTRLAGRCLYDINRAVSENNFTLVGANWFRAVRDPYVRYRNIQSNPNVTEAQCTGQPGYTVNCETSASSLLLFNAMLVITSSFLGIIYKYGAF